MNWAGERLRALRKAKGLTQTELAEKAGVNRKTLWVLEKGNGGVTLYVYSQLLDALGCELRIVPKEDR